MKKLCLLWLFVGFIIKTKVENANLGWPKNNDSPIFNNLISSPSNSIKIVASKPNDINPTLSYNINAQLLKNFPSLQLNPKLSSLCKTAIFSSPSTITTIFRLRFLPSNPCITIYKPLKPLTQSSTLPLLPSLPVVQSQIPISSQLPQFKAFLVKNLPPSPTLLPTKPLSLPLYKTIIAPKLKLSTPITFNYQQYPLAQKLSIYSPIPPLTMPNSLVINQPNIQTSIAASPTSSKSTPLPACSELLPESLNSVELFPLPCVPNISPTHPSLTATKLLLPNPAPLPPCTQPTPCFSTLLSPTVVTFSTPPLLSCASPCAPTSIITNPTCNPPLCYKIIPQSSPLSFYASPYDSFRSYSFKKKNEQNDETINTRKTKNYRKI